MTAAVIHLPCPECGKVFTSRRGLGPHRATAHGIPGTNSRASRAKTDEQKLMAGICEVCGVRWSEHPRCAGCGIGVGKGHIERRLFDDRCIDCVRIARLRALA